MISLFIIAGLYVAATVDSFPQLIQPFDQNSVGSSDGPIAFNFNSDSPQDNAIGRFDSLTNPSNFWGSTAGLEDLTKSTENAQTSPVLSNDPALWLSYNLPTSEVSAAPNTPSDAEVLAAPNTPSNSDVSSGSVVPYNANDSPKPPDSLTANDQTPISSVKEVPDTPGEDELVAQELVIPKGGIFPEIGVPRGIIPSSSDVTPPVQDTTVDPDLTWTHVEPYPRIEGEEKHEPDCTQLKGHNPRKPMCCTKGPPFQRGSYKTGQSILDLQKLTRRGNCDLWKPNLPSCFSPFNRFCCFCRDKRKWAYDCYSPYFRFLEFDTVPNAAKPNLPSKAQPGPATHHLSPAEVAAELGNGLLGIPIRPGREFWEGPQGGPTGSTRGPGRQHVGSEPREGSCSREYLEHYGVKYKEDAPKGRPF
ncbi:hypothetical protein MMC07_008068 [Pseudocyphellaria aurata]|nr:hypothetical protein [Pseudocyphellaria aurata]